MTPNQFYSRVVVPAAQAFSFEDSPLARAFLMAVAGQESGWRSRLQLGGPARGFWQFERTGATARLMSDLHLAPILGVLCATLEIPFDGATVFAALAWNDTLAYGLARLLLWSDPVPLPQGAEEAWEQYLRLWRPGTPRVQSWAGNYALAVRAVGL